MTATLTLIETATTLTDDNASAVDKALAKFNVSMAEMTKHIDDTLTTESIKLGAEWYREAHAFALSLSIRFTNTPHHVHRMAGVISALSPRMGWVQNKKVAEKVIEEWTDGKSASQIKGALGANIRIAVAILDGGDINTVLTGVKRRSFYNNIVSAGVGNDVTIDTWMQRAAMAVVPDAGMDLDASQAFLKAMNHAGYVAIANAVRTVADKRGLSPATIQAAYWIVASGSVHGWHFKGHGKDAVTY